MITRRGIFGLLAGAAVAPALKPLEKLIPVEVPVVGPFTQGQWSDRTYDPPNTKMPDLVKICYEREFIANLKSNNPLMSMMKNKSLPFIGGEQIKLFNYSLKEAS